MNKKIAYITLMCSTLIVHELYPFSFNSIFKQTKEKITSLFGPSIKTEVIQQDIPRTTQKSLVIENLQGSIKIKTDWNQQTVSFKAIKKAPQEVMSKILITVDSSSDPDKIALKTVYNDIQEYTDKCTVDFSLMIPKQMSVSLKTGKGDIKVKRFDGTVQAITDYGTIEIANVSDKVTAHVAQAGNITIAHSHGIIEAATEYGDITIDGAKQSIRATTQEGDIVVAATQVPPTSSIQLNSSGTLELHLPQETNAHLKAQATHGKINSDHYITLAPLTTKLNNQTWAQLQKNIEGSLGTGEAEISLASSYGSIKIMSGETA